MHSQQLLVYEHDGRLTRLLHDTVQAQRGWLRELRHPEACLNLLRREGRAVLVLAIGRNLEREFGLLEEVTWRFPDTAVVVVGDTDHAALAALAWDLGARFVLMPPLPRERLPEIVQGLMSERPSA
jgi:DNA-binding NarL/FixJ family response regulator